MKCLISQAKDPSDEFVRVLAKATHSGVIGPKKLGQFREITKQALKEFINLQVNTRLQTAMTVSEGIREGETDNSLIEEEKVSSDESGIETTEEELQSYRIVQAILASEVEPERVTWRDTKSYFNILLDNNGNRKICRLYLNQKSIKRIGLFDQEQEYKQVITSVRDIYKYSAQLKGALAKYENKIAAS